MRELAGLFDRKEVFRSQLTILRSDPPEFSGGEITLLEYCPRMESSREVVAL